MIGKPSGKFVLRLDPVLHGLLQAAAKGEGTSLNQVCIQRLLGVTAPGEIREITTVISRAAELFGANLSGVVLFGSFARGEAMQNSDVDVLVVLNEGAAITRDLYKRWEEKELIVSSRTVEPSIVALPKESEPPSGLWAEVALDGVVVWDSNGRIHRHLARVRKNISEGKLRRENVHGQNYWIHDREAYEKR